MIGAARVAEVSHRTGRVDECYRLSECCKTLLVERFSELGFGDGHSCDSAVGLFDVAVLKCLVLGLEIRDVFVSNGVSPVGSPMKFPPSSSPHWPFLCAEFWRRGKWGLQPFRYFANLAV